MRYRNIKKQFWFNREECDKLSTNARKSGLNESEYIRQLLMGYELKEKPDHRFYDELRNLYNLANNLNQIAKKANALGFIDEIEYKKNVSKVIEFIDNFKETYLLNEVKI